MGTDWDFGYVYWVRGGRLEGAWDGGVRVEVFLEGFSGSVHLCESAVVFGLDCWIE